MTLLLVRAVQIRCYPCKVPARWSLASLFQGGCRKLQN